MPDLPDGYTHAVAITLGLLFGSFVNVLVARLPQGQSIVRPGSRCPRCKKAIRWWDNLPVLSFLMLRGRCRQCKKRISIRYPIIELITAFLFLAARNHHGWSLALLIRVFPFLTMLVAITFIDLEHRIIPNVLSYGGLVLGLTTCWLDPRLGCASSVIGAGLGFGVFYLLAWLYQTWSGRTGLGGGDIKLLAMLGAFLGPSGVFATIFISSIFGSVVGIVWALKNGKKNVMRVSIPYGPFLIVGGLYYYLLGDVLWFQFMNPT